MAAVGGRGERLLRGDRDPPDLKESFAVGADLPTGDPEVDAYWFAPNVWPHEVDQMQPVITAHLREMRALAEELLVICAVALGQPPDSFTRHTGHATHTRNVNWYPPVTVVGQPEPGQFRIGPHTDSGAVTILDRELGQGGLQVWTPDGAGGGWENAPWDPEAFTVNTGDLLARWSGDRWRSNRHRVLPPQPGAPEQELVSQVYFYEADHDTVVKALQPPVGRANTYEPVVASAFLRERLDAITVG